MNNFDAHAKQKNHLTANNQYPLRPDDYNFCGRQRQETKQGVLFY
jgi:hypothetical protein